VRRAVVAGTLLLIANAGILRHEHIAKLPAIALSWWTVVGSALQVGIKVPFISSTHRGSDFHADACACAPHRDRQRRDGGDPPRSGAALSGYVDQVIDSYSALPLVADARGTRRRSTSSHQPLRDVGGGRGISAEVRRARDRRRRSTRRCRKRPRERTAADPFLCADRREPSSYRTRARGRALTDRQFEMTNAIRRVQKTTPPPTPPPPPDSRSNSAFLAVPWGFANSSAVLRVRDQKTRSVSP